MDIQVGDRVTYRIIDKNRIINEIVTNDNVGLSGICWFREHLKEGFIEILKIERPKYEVVEEKKELLTEAERKYLFNVIKPWKDRVEHITKNKENSKKEYIAIRILDDFTVIFPNFPENTLYKGMERYKEYTLEELGL